MLTSQLGERTPPMGYPPLNGQHITMDATCGLGHRLQRNAQIFHSARCTGYSVGVDWFPWAELFDDTEALFASENEQDPAFTFSNEASEIRPRTMTGDEPAITFYSNMVIQSELTFDFAGCADERRWQKEVFGPAAADHTADFHLRLASQLRPRWVQRIDGFLAEVVRGRRLVAIHLRTGNGETGDFEEKGRVVGAAEIMTSFARELDSYPLGETAVFVASDSTEPAELLRKYSDHEIVVFSTALPESGFTLGDWVAPNSPQATNQQSGDERVDQFFEAYADGLLLGMADDLYAGAWSSFLAGPFLMNRRRADLGTNLSIYDSHSSRWRPV